MIFIFLWQNLCISPIIGSSSIKPSSSALGVFIDSDLSKRTVLCARYDSCAVSGDRYRPLSSSGYRAIHQLTNSVTRRFGDKAGRFGERLGRFGNTIERFGHNFTNSVTRQFVSATDNSCLCRCRFRLAHVIAVILLTDIPPPNCFFFYFYSILLPRDAL